MKSETKLFLGILLGTVAIIAIGIYLLSKPPSSVKVDVSRLVREDSHKIATDSARVTLVEFSDFQCPACAAYFEPVKQLLHDFPTDITFVYRNYPLTTIHKNAQMAAQAAEAAGLQGKYWEMHDMLFEKQSEWSASDNVKEIFLGYAKTLGIAIDIDGQKIKDLIAQDVADGNALGISGTPTFFLNGEKIANPATYEDFKTLVKAALLKAPVPSASTEVVHMHFNFAASLGGVTYDFSLPKYQELDPAMHFHDNKGDMVHIHKANIAMGQFINSLGLPFAGAKMYVNGKEQSSMMEYVPKDLDRILLTDGPMLTLADDACIYSEKCPERGTPPTEKCVGGLGTDCKD